LRRRNNKNPATRIAVAFFGVLLIGAVGLFLGSPPGSRTGTIAIGLACSLTAAFGYSFLENFLTGDARQQLHTNIQALAATGASLNRSQELLREAEAYQVDVIKPKQAYTELEWLALLHGARHSLMMVGHALDRWCETPTIKQEFCEAIRRVVDNGGEVRLLMLAERANRVPKLRNKGYSERIQRTLQVLRRLNGELNGPGKLSVYHLGDGLDMPYMMVANEQTVITAPYPATAQSSNRMPAMRLACDSAIARQLQADIDALLEGQVTSAKL
jgi:hypothetical protein